MPATPQNVTFSEDDLKERLSYDDIEEGDYEATLVDVEDIEANSGNYGWGFKFMVKGLPLSTSLWLKGGGGWKIREVFNALGQPLAPGEQAANLNPNPLIGRTCVVTVKRVPGRNNPEKMYLEISKHTPFVKADVPDMSDLS
jgi:hypothetical protein